jgi:Zn-dependent peptidase ImmA (M78 family)/transcriptional regulator with XRE-family HTH domain
MAKSIKAIVKPALLEWARVSASLSQEDAAKGIGVSLARLQEWESGKASPTISQLRHMAEKYKRPLSVFYLPEKPVDFQPLRDYRRLTDAAQRHYSPQLAYEVRAAFERRLVALDVLDEIKEEPQLLGVEAKRTDNPETVAARLRERLGIDLTRQHRWGDTDTAFRAWRDAMEAAGILVFVLGGAHHQVSVQEMRGFAIAEQPLPAVVVNGKDYGKVFTLLHELAHVVVGQSVIENSVEAGDELPAPDRALERFCNQIAAATLMPADALLREAIVAGKTVRSQWSEEEIVALARRYGVSREALLVRLVELNRVSQAFYHTKRAQYARQRDETVEEETTGFPPYRYQVLSHIGRGFARLILQGYHDNRLTLSTVAGYLNVQAKYVPSIESAAFGVPA